MVDRRLGRGLDFFLSGGRKPANPSSQTPLRDKAPPEASEAAVPDGERLQMVPIQDLQPNPFQPRKDMDPAELKTLSESISKSGILQPILARQVGDTHQIVAGERRWRAAQLAGLEEVPVLSRSISDEESAVFALVENLQREDLNAIEKAKGFRLLMSQMNATQEQVAKQVGFERSTVANFLRLLDLPEPVQAHVSRGTLSMGHARALLALPDEESMTATAEFSIKNTLSVRALEAKIKEMLAAVAGNPGAVTTDTNGKAKKSRPVWLNEIEESLVEALSTPVTVKYGRKRSQIIIECAGREEFDRVFARIKNA